MLLAWFMVMVRLKKEKRVKPVGNGLVHEKPETRVG